jgi:hypothetical protein
VTRAERKQVRKLNVRWAHERMTAIQGCPFLASPSNVTGKMYSADENALIALHKMRTQIGTPAEIVESRAWLTAEGLNGLFEAPLSAN